MIPRRCVWVWMCVYTYVHLRVCLCIAWMFSFGKWGTLKQCFSLFLPVFAYQCLCLCLPASLCLHFLSHRPQYLLPLCPIFCTQRGNIFFSQPVATLVLSSQHICSFPISHPFFSFDYPLYFTSFQHFSSPDLLNFLSFHPLRPLRLLIHSHFHLSLSLCCLFDQGAVFIMKAQSKSPNHSEAQDSDTAKV